MDTTPGAYSSVTRPYTTEPLVILAVYEQLYGLVVDCFIRLGLVKRKCFDVIVSWLV